MSHDPRLTRSRWLCAWRMLTTASPAVLNLNALGFSQCLRKIGRPSFFAIIAVFSMHFTGCGSIARATPITFAFEAVALDDRPFNIVAGMIAHGTYTFESTTPISLFGNTGLYTGAATALDLQLVGVGTAHNTGPGTIIVADPITIVGSNPGTADFYAINGIPVSGFSVSGSAGTWSLVGFFLTFEDRTDSALSSFALPLTPPDPLQFADEHSILLNFQSSTGSTSAAEFLVTSLTLAPEPSTLCLAVLAVIGVGVWRWPRKR